jgi:uncharacterized protein YegL
MGNLSQQLWRFYVLVDVSESMGRLRSDGSVPWKTLQAIIPNLYKSLGDVSLGVRHRTWLSIMTFASTVKPLLQLSSLQVPLHCDELPPPLGQTDLAAALDAVTRQIGEDQDRLSRTHTVEDWRRPVVFVLTDGDAYVGQAAQPKEVWLAARERFLSKWNGRIVALGFGAASDRTIWELATVAGSRLAFIADGTVNTDALLGGIEEAIRTSITDSAAKGEFAFPAPTGMRLANC